MKKEVIFVPEDKSPLDVLAELGERSRNSWIFIHKTTYGKLILTCNTAEPFPNSDWYTLCWNHLKTKIRGNTTVLGDWVPILYISASDIAFEKPSDNPEELFFLQM